MNNVPYFQIQGGDQASVCQRDCCSWGKKQYAVTAVSILLIKALTPGTNVVCLKEAHRESFQGN